MDTTMIKSSEAAAILTVREIQKLLKVSQATAYKLIHSDLFPVVRIGRCYRIPYEPFFQWLEQNCSPSEEHYAGDDSCILAQLRNGGVIYGEP